MRSLADPSPTILIPCAHQGVLSPPTQDRRVLGDHCHRSRRDAPALPAESPTANVLSDQFVENVVVKWDTFAGAGAFDVLDEVDSGIACATDRAIAGSPNDLLEPLLLPGAVVRIPGELRFLGRSC